DRSKRWRIGTWITIALCALVIVFGHTSLTWGYPKFMAYNHAGGWQAVAQKVDATRADLRKQTGQEPFILGLEKYGAPEIGFYLIHPEEWCISYACGAPGLVSRFWTALQNFEGRPAVAVFPSPPGRLLDQLRQHFDHVGDAEHTEVPASRTRHRDVWLIN